MIFFITLIFISKVALSFIPGFPSEIYPIIYQYGLHPYLNIGFCLVIGSFLFFRKMLKFGIQNQSRFFRLFVVLTCLYLVLITLMQIIFQKSDEPISLQLAACFLSIFMIYICGRVVPLQLKAVDFIRYIRLITVTLCWLSILGLIISPSTSFKGGRFIGIFKHIPHMVSCATLACSMLLYDLFCMKLNRWQSARASLNFLCGFFLLVLTGTRSALAAVLMGLALAFIIFPAKSQAIRLLKSSLVLSTLLVGLFFGDNIIDYSIQVVRGEQNVGLRAGQDGVASRLDEVERGFRTFQESPWLGHGLLSKFGSARSDSENDIGAYNANKDPHNMFISAGVVGGWGLVTLTVIGYFALFIAALKNFIRRDPALQILAIYILTQMPILFIYHIHLSLGGIADRIYWIIFGYMAVIKVSQKQNEESASKD